MSNDGVINALSAALAATPADNGIRLHLASLLFDKGQAAAALEHYTTILAADPVNLDALKGAALAAERANEPTRAAGYRRLCASLGAPIEGAAVESRKEVGPVVPAKAITPPRPGQPPKLRVIQGGTDAAADDDGPLPETEPAEPPITLADVGGLEQVKRRLDLAFLAPLRNPEVRKMYGKKLKGGLLMYGPPGCGKTYIARALAGELRASFMSVGLSDVLDMWLGESERKLHELFEPARRQAPTVLFFDEIDALGQKRANLKNSAVRNVVNQLLTEMDSVGSDNKDVFILGATNHPWDVDAALRRSGRFDRVVLVLPPDAPAREAILTKHLDGRPVGDIDVRGIAAQTAHFSGADLAHLCETATELAMEEALRSGTARPITTADFKKALKDVRPTTRAWFDLAKNYAMFANEGGAYDDLLAYIKEQKF
jgi:SpoVK/Ycf46/Vps4 family AAA+-type ATPase